jgi:hypothetical protein
MLLLLARFSLPLFPYGVSMRGLRDRARGFVER